MPSKPPGPRAVSWILIAAAFLLVAGGVYGLTRAMDAEEPPPRGVQTSVSSSPLPDATRPSQPRTAATTEPPARAVPVPPVPEPRDRADVSTAPRPPAPSTVAEAKTFTEADAKAALSEVRIEMYATSWCGSCRRAREYMDFNAISYTEYDIDSDPEAKARLSMINPRKSIPTFQIDDIVQVGFSAENFEHRLNEAVRVRLHR
jgi:glutaredoxin